MSNQNTKPLDGSEDSERRSLTDESKDNCPICQDELKDLESIRTLPCAHKFHNDCIQKWIEMRNLCPLCNQVADTTQPVRELSNDNRELTHQMIQSLLQNSINPSGVDFWMHLLEGFGLRNRPRQPFVYSNAGRPGNITIESYAFDIENRNGALRMNMSMTPEVFSLFPRLMQIDDYGIDDDDDDEIVFSSTMSMLEEMEDSASRPHESSSDPTGVGTGGILSQPVIPSGSATSFERRSEESRTRERRPDGMGNSDRRHRLWSEVITERTSQEHNNTNNSNTTTQHLLLEPAHSDACEQAQCANCYKLDCIHAIKRCSGCHQIRYCSKECQDENWNQHKDWCFSHRHSQ